MPVDSIKVLVIVTDYPDLLGNTSLMYVHTRNIEYLKSGINVTVLSYKTQKNYIIDGIGVITFETYLAQNEQYDILICHSANIRNHYRFLKKYGDRFPRFIFFFHGHEVLRVNRTYPKPYPYMRKNAIKYCVQDIYDSFKLCVWKYYFLKVAYKSQYVFVSKWMLDEFLKSTKIDFNIIKDKYAITYNCIGKEFENVFYNIFAEKKYDFVIIRSYFDESKYGIDYVNNLAKVNSNSKFLLVGKGKYFEHYNKSDNIVWQSSYLNHAEIIELLQTARCALMPTRTDAQGVMACEMASIGMPVITSDIPVCHEVFDDFENVALIPNDDLSVDLNGICKRLEEKLPYKKNEKYYNKNTSAKEIELIKKIYNEISK